MSPDIAQWTVGAEVQRKWRQALKLAIEHSELTTVDALSGLPTAPVRTELGAAAEQRDERQRRRFDRLRDLGGDRSPNYGGGWKASGTHGALAALAREEAGLGHPYSDVRDVARDLDAEADRRKGSRLMPRG